MGLLVILKASFPTITRLLFRTHMYLWFTLGHTEINVTEPTDDLWKWWKHPAFRVDNAKGCICMGQASVLQRGV